MPRNKMLKDQITEAQYNTLKRNSDETIHRYQDRMSRANAERDRLIRTTREANGRVSAATRTAEQEAAARRAAEQEAAKSSNYANKLSQHLAKKLEEKNRPKAAARTIQKAWGQAADRLKENRRNNAATKIQSHARGHNVRSAIRNSILHNGAAAEIQDAWKNHHRLKGLRQSFSTSDNAGNLVKAQARVRGNQTRTKHADSIRTIKQRTADRLKAQKSGFDLIDRHPSEEKGGWELL